MPELAATLLPLAHHPVVESLPFVVPTVVITAVLIAIKLRDRGGENR